LIHRPKGTYDLFGDSIPYWHHFERKANETARLFGFSEIRTPILERTELFVRGVGDDTDIVKKEMYTFDDKGKRSMTMRPEGTAPVIRAFIENAMINQGLPQKMYYIGPMFRYERPQAGRQRQFHQFGVEIIGSSDPNSDVETIWNANYLLDSLCLHNATIHINHLGCKKDRENYKNALKDYYSKHFDSLCDDCKRRYDTNILRLLDCKKKHDIELKKDAPKLIDYLCDECSQKYDTVKLQLKELNIDYFEDSFLVRGLDYYTGMVFEIKHPYQDTELDILGGGRYDDIIGELGGKKTPAVGYACGIERILAIMQEEDVLIAPPLISQVYVLSITKEAERHALRIVEFLRKRGISVERDLMGRSLKSQMKYASKINCRFTVIIGEDEIEKGVFIVKNMKTGNQTSVESSWIENYLLDKLDQ